MSNGSNGSGGRRPPPVGGNASRAQSFTPGGQRGNQRLKTIGERDPNETGMLQMVPLATDGASSEAAADPSATAFFAIPAPKTNRARPAAPAAAPPPPVPGGPMGGPPIASAGMGAAPPPPRTPPPPRPSYGGGIGAGGAGGVAAAGAAGGIAQGPVAGYGNAGGGNGQTPFQVQGGPGGATTSNPNESRSRSYQIYAILFGLFVMVCVTTVLVVWLVLINREDPADTVIAQTPTTDNTPVVMEEPEDTGEAVAVEPDPPPRRNPTPRRDTTPRPPSEPKAPSTPSGEVRVTLNSETPFTAVEVVCPSGTRKRGYFNNGSAKISGVPSEACSLNFKGGAPAKFSPVSGGSSLKCTFNGSTMMCS